MQISTRALSAAQRAARLEVRPGGGRGGARARCFHASG
jgi:hypothetical protein